MLAIVGVGLIGGSFALAARKARLFTEVVGIDRSPEHGAQALAAGIVDRMVDAVPAAASAVLLAVPSDQVASWLERLADHRGLIFDVASVKGPVLQAAGRRPARYVPAHPIAGSEFSGPGAARGDLFAEHLVVLTPDADTDAEAVIQLTRWWQQVGARVEHMSAEAHDQLFALTSHLPHLAAFAYMQLIEARHLPFAAGGFRDFSRIAASDPDMWAPVLRSNAGALLPRLDSLVAELQRMRQAIVADTDTELRGLLTAARDRRREFPVQP